MRRLIGAKFCTLISNRPNFIMPVQNFGWLSPKKNSGAKNMQNLARFWSTLMFDHQWQISPAGMKIFKIGQVCDLPQFFLHLAKKVW